MCFHKSICNNNFNNNGDYIIGYYKIESVLSDNEKELLLAIHLQNFSSVFLLLNGLGFNGICDYR